jgi:hypothetical protein
MVRCHKAREAGPAHHSPRFLVSSRESSPHPFDSVADEEDSDNAFAYIEEIVSDTKDCVGDLPPALQAEARERARAKRINSPVTSAPPHVVVNAGLTFAPTVYITAPNATVTFNVAAQANAPTVHVRGADGSQHEARITSATERVDIMAGCRDDLLSLPLAHEGGPSPVAKPVKSAFAQLMSSNTQVCSPLCIPSPARVDPAVNFTGRPRPAQDCMYS